MISSYIRSVLALKWLVIDQQLPDTFITNKYQTSEDKSGHYKNMGVTDML